MKEKYRLKKMVEEKRKVEERVMGAFSDAYLELEGRLAELLGIKDLVGDQKSIWMDGMTKAGRLRIENQVVGDEHVTVIYFDDKPLCTFTMPRLAGMDDKPGAVISYRFEVAHEAEVQGVDRATNDNDNDSKNEGQQ